ncbi:hypothetical protein ABCN43_11115 [Halobacterium salinarum]
MVGLAVASGFGVYTFGSALRHGQDTLPLETLQIAVTMGCLALLVGFVQRTSKLGERVDTDHLLTTVPAHEVVLGVVLAVAARTATRVSLTAVSVAIGFAVGTGAPASAFTILVAVAGLFALTALLGVALSFAVQLVTTRSPRFRRYKNALIVIGFFLVLGGWTAIDLDQLTSGFLRRWLTSLPTAWFVDLGLLGSPSIQSGRLRSLGAFALVAGGIPVVTVVTTALATRVWETEPVSSAVLHRSRSLVGDGLEERLFAGHVSRPVLTVARKRWLQKRRVPRALLMAGYVFLLVLLVVIPALAAGGVRLAPLLVAFVLAAESGLAFGLAPVATEYSSLPMTLTSSTGKQFVRGTLLAGVAIGTPVTGLATFGLGVLGPPGVFESVLLGVTGVGLSVCAITVAAAVGMGVSYRDLVAAPVPLTSSTMYGEIGGAGFVRMGKLLGLVALVCSPAVVGYLSVVFDPVSTMLGVPAVAVRVGSLAVTIGLAVGVSTVAYRRAVRLYDDYTLV